MAVTKGSGQALLQLKEAVQGILLQRGFDGDDRLQNFHLLHFFQQSAHLPAAGRRPGTVFEQGNRTVCLLYTSPISRSCFLCWIVSIEFLN